MLTESQKITAACEAADLLLRTICNEKIEVKTEEGIRYTEAAQNSFNLLYDEIRSLIEKLELEERKNK